MKNVKRINKEEVRAAMKRMKSGKEVGWRTTTTKSLEHKEPQSRLKK